MVQINVLHVYFLACRWWLGTEINIKYYFVLALDLTMPGVLNQKVPYN